MATDTELLAQLSRGEESALTPSLRLVLAELRQHGFQIVDVHADAVRSGSFEVLLDRPIPREWADTFRLPEGVELYEDYDQHDSFVGMGFISEAAGQCINGRW